VIWNEDYAEIRVPFADLHESLAKFEKTLAYRRLSSRKDGAWGLVWDLKVHQDLEAADLRIRALTAALRAATALLSPSQVESIRSVYREAENV
jgi:hypothetical protein